MEPRPNDPWRDHSPLLGRAPVLLADGCYYDEWRGPTCVIVCISADPLWGRALEEGKLTDNEPAPPDLRAAILAEQTAYAFEWDWDGRRDPSQFSPQRLQQDSGQGPLKNAATNPYIDEFRGHGGCARRVRQPFPPDGKGD